jgi:hypothetical protein
MDQDILDVLLKTWLMPSVVSALFAFLLGIIWYHPAVLGNKWIEARGKKWEDLPKSSTPFVISFPLWFLTSLFFTFMIIYFQISSPEEIFLLACLLWVAFAMPPIVMGSLYTGDPFNAVAVDASYQLAGYYAIALTHVVINRLELINL